MQGRRVTIPSLAPAIQQAGYAVHVVYTGDEALAVGRPLLFIFDARGMRSSGSRVCRKLAQSWGNVPIIHCRAEGVKRDDSAEATVYVAEPFTPRKILNRIKKLLPAEDSADQIHRFGDITLYTGKRSVQVDGLGESTVTPKLIKLLLTFIERPDEIVTREELIHRVWNTTYTGDTRTLDVHIRWLREKIEENASDPKRLITERGIGYRLLSIPLP